MDASASGLRQLSARARVEILAVFLKKDIKSFLVTPGGCSRERFPVASTGTRIETLVVILKDQKRKPHFIS